MEKGIKEKGNIDYLHWDQKILTDFSENSVTLMYKNGYVFTRLGKGVMDQTRSVRVDLSKFSPSSENRRILKKVVALTLKAMPLPLADYDWKLGKRAKDFYETKFGPGIMSAQKIKEMMSDGTKSNFNTLLEYSIGANEATAALAAIGFAICYVNSEIIHYSFPFYDFGGTAPKSMGLAMMITAIQYAKDAGKKYVYLGSLQRPSDTYKLQFEGLEWFDGKEWKQDLEEVKRLLTKL